jgi:KaiC
MSCSAWCKIRTRSDAGGVAVLDTPSRPARRIRATSSRHWAQPRRWSSNSVILTCSEASIAWPSTGAGKTLMGLHFIFRGAAHGEPGILATLQESSAQLERITSGYGWAIDAPGVHIHSRSPVGLLIDEWLHELLAVAEETNARRLVVDSLGDLFIAAGDELRFREYMSSLIQRCTRQKISLLMTHEVPELFGLTRLSEFGISHLCDNVVLLQYVHPTGTCCAAPLRCSRPGPARTSRCGTNFTSPSTESNSPTTPRLLPTVTRQLRDS